MTTVQPSALNFEQSHVHQVYDLIAQDFSRTRHTRWPFVETFLESLPPCSVVLDAGCGNGKYLGVHSCVPCDYQPLRPKIGASSDLASNGAKDHSVTPALLNIGLDMSRGLLGIAAERGHEVVRADCYDSAACFRPGTIDHAISIATIHHFSSHARRVEAVRQIILAMLSPKQSEPATSLVTPRRLRQRQRALIVVWSLEQDPALAGQGSARRLKPKGQAVESKVIGAVAGLSSRADPDHSTHELDLEVDPDVDVFVPWAVKNDESGSKVKVPPRVAPSRPTKKSIGASARDSPEWATMNRDERKAVMMAERKRQDAQHVVPDDSSVPEDTTVTVNEPEVTTYQRYYHLFRYGELSQVVRDACASIDSIRVRSSSPDNKTGLGQPLDNFEINSEYSRTTLVLDPERWERENWVVEFSLVEDGQPTN